MPTYDLGITVTGHDRASSVFKPVEESIRRVFEVATGILVSKVLGGIAEGLGQIAMKGLDATAQLQSMRVSLESLAARELVKASDGMLTLADVEGKAGQMAGEMMDEISKMSLISPYTVEAVQNTFRLNTAFGYTFEEAKRMTDGLLKMAAGVGADNEQLNRMAYNLAQVRMQGKVMAVDVRQLAMAGLDLEDVLRKVSAQYGYQIKDHTEFNELIKDGKITWEQFSTGFAEYADKYFGKAAEKMSKTLVGLKSTFSDIFILTLPKIVGPAVEKVTVVLGKMLDIFIKIRDTDLLDKMGVNLSKNLDKILVPFEKMVDGIGVFVDVWLAAQGYTAEGLPMEKAQEQLKSLATPLQLVETFLNNAFGEKMGGLILGGVTRIVEGAKKIGEAFSLLIGGDFEGAFATLGVPQALLDFVEDVINAASNLKTFWDQNGSDILSILGELGTGILEFAGLQLGAALEGTGGFFERMTQSMIDNGPQIVEKFREIKDYVLNDLLPAIDSFISKVTDVWIPKAMEFGEYLRDNWQPIFEKVSKVVLAVAAAFGAWTVMSAVAPVIIGIVQALLTLAGQVALSGGVTGFLAALGAIGTTVLPYVAAILGTIAAVVGIVIAGFIAFAGAVSYVKKHWDTFAPIFTSFWNSLKANVAPVFAQLGQAMGPLKDALGQLMAAFAPLGEFLWAILKPVLEVIGGVVILILINGIAILTGIVTGVVAAFTSFVTTLTNIISFVATFVTGVVDMFQGFFTMLVGIFTLNQDTIKAGWDMFLQGTGEVLQGIIGVMISAIVGFFDGVISFVLSFTQGFASIWAGFWGAVKELSTGKMQEIAEYIYNKYQEMLGKLRDFGDKFKEVGAAIINGIKIGISNAWGSLVDWFRDQLASLMNMVYGVFDMGSPSKKFIYVGKMMTEGLRIGLSGLLKVMDSLVMNPLKALTMPDVKGVGAPNSYNTHTTSYFAPIYNIIQQSPDRITAASAW